eukprot:Rmarinus@m.29282
MSGIIRPHKPRKNSISPIDPEDSKKSRQLVADRLLRNLGDEYSVIAGINDYLFFVNEKGMAEKLRDLYMFSPSSPFIRIWDVLIGFLLLYQAIIIPFRLSFEEDPEQAWGAFDYFVDFLFFVDITIQFNTAYLDERGEAVTDRRKIALRYFKGFFILDMLSTFPFTLFENDSNALQVNRLLRIFRLFRLFKLLRMMRMEALIHEYGEVFSLNANVMKIVKLVFWILLLSHFGACLWHALVLYDTGYPTWLEAYQGDFCYEATDLGCYPIETAASKYLVALYYVGTTMTTVGYGDVTPRSDHERFFALVVVIVGATGFAYIVGNVSSLMANVNQVNSLQKRRLEELNDFMNYRHLPTELKRRVRKYCEFVWAQRSAFDEEKIMKDLSEGLREEVALVMNKELIELVPLFHDAPRDFVQAIVTKLSPARYMPGEFVVKEGEESHEMFLIKSGELEVLKLQPDGGGFASLRRLKAGSHFGEIGILSDEIVCRTSTVVAVTPCELYALSKPDLKDALKRHPALEAEMKQQAESLIRLRPHPYPDTVDDTNSKSETPAHALSNATSTPNGGIHSSPFIEADNTEGDMSGDEPQTAVENGEILVVQTQLPGQPTPKSSREGAYRLSGDTSSGQRSPLPQSPECVPPERPSSPHGDLRSPQTSAHLKKEFEPILVPPQRLLSEKMDNSTRRAYDLALPPVRPPARHSPNPAHSALPDVTPTASSGGASAKTTGRRPDVGLSSSPRPYGACAQGENGQTIVDQHIAEIKKWQMRAIQNEKILLDLAARVHFMDRTLKDMKEGQKDILRALGRAGMT